MKGRCRGCNMDTDISPIRIGEASTKHEAKTLLLCQNCQKKYEQGNLTFTVKENAE